jgi:hypothetical protein
MGISPENEALIGMSGNMNPGTVIKLFAKLEKPGKQGGQSNYSTQ